MDFENLQKKGTLFIVTAPSGAGKSTLIKNLISNTKNINFSISYTTREKRADEVNGKDYFFVSESEFLKMAEQGKFLEHALVFDKYYYGTSKVQVEKSLQNGVDIIMDIDVQGAMQLMEKKNISSTSIFILPPTVEELRERLIIRGRESKDEIEKRLKVAENEIEYLSRFDYLLINGELSIATTNFLSIINAERLKTIKLLNI